MILIMNGKTMHHLLKLFNSGQYKSVYNNLLKQQVEQENVGNQLTQQLLQENNIAVCMSLMRESHTHGSSKENVNFMSILKKFYSIPANKQCLIVELTVLYNYIYNELVCGDKLDDDLQCYNYIYKTCHRVLVSTSIGPKLKKSDFLNYSDVRVAVWSSIQKCLTVLQLQTDPGLLEAFLLLALILCVKEIKNNQCAIVKQCLRDIHKMVTKGQLTLDDKDTYTLVLRLPLCVDHVELNSLNISEVFRHVSSLLLSICLADTKSWDEIVKILDTNNSGSTKSVSKFYIGFTLYKLDRIMDSVSCLMEVLRCTDSMTQRLNARVCNLIGQCFMKLDKSHLSVQMFKEALCADFSYLLPLYNTSLQYRQQGMDNLELECLNLLSTALEMRSSSPTEDNRVDLLSLLDTEDADVQYEFVLYSLAYRTLQLQRYEVSSEKYMQLIEHLKSGNGCLKDKSTIPSVVQIHHEAIESLFKSEKFTECVNLCDKLILCYHGNLNNQTVLLSQTLDQSFLSQSQINWNDSLIIEQSCTPVALNNTLTGSQTGNQSFSQSRNQSFSQTGTQSGKKRKHCEITESQKDDDGGNIDIVALRYKAECLHKLGDFTTALSCLQSALDSITSSRRRKLHHCMNKITDSVSLEPNSKKQKTGSTTSLVQDAEVLPQSKTNNNVVNILDDSLESLKLECLLYEKTAEILTSLKQMKDAQHFSRLADQIKFVEQKKG